MLLLVMLGRAVETGGDRGKDLIKGDSGDRGRVGCCILVAGVISELMKAPCRLP